MNFNDFLRSCAEDCINGESGDMPRATSMRDEDQNHGCYCECPDCEPAPPPVSLFDREEMAGYQARMHFGQAKLHAERLMGIPLTDDKTAQARRLAWANFREAMFWLRDGGEQ